MQNKHVQLTVVCRQQTGWQKVANLGGYYMRRVDPVLAPLQPGTTIAIIWKHFSKQRQYINKCWFS